MFVRPTVHWGIDEEAKFTCCRIDSLTSVLELYRLRVGAYPSSLDDLLQLPAGTTGNTWRGPYVDSGDKLKDAWGQPFRYKAPGVKNSGRYDLWSAGKDGVDGTADDICNW